jgi:hypothetical protein
MAKRQNRKGSYLPVKIPINTLSGGVGRQAPSKRLPTEAEELTNVFCTTERSIDKRNGFDYVTNGEILDGLNSEYEYYFYWFISGNERKFLIAVSLEPEDENLLHVFKFTEDGVVTQNVNDSFSNEIIRYIRMGFGNTVGNYSKDLRATTVGSSVLLLNTNVFAGFTSDGESEYGFDLDGTHLEETEENIDVIGRKITYTTALGVDPKGEAEYWNEFNDFIQGQVVIDGSQPSFQNQDGSPANGNPPKVVGEGSAVHGAAAISNNQLTEDGTKPGTFFMYRVKSAVKNDKLPGVANATNDDFGPPRPATVTNNSSLDDPTWSGGATWQQDFIDDSDENNTDTTIDATEVQRVSEFIPVEDYVYPDTTKLYLGQSVPRLSDLKFPPDATDVIAYNGGEKVQDALKTLYPNESNIEGKGDSLGRGKIIYLSQSYLTSTPGWYRYISSTVTPYLRQIRTPDEMSVIDKKRMPVQIFFDEANNQWDIKQVDWDVRKSGNTTTNPGPSFFKDADNKAKQVKIKAMSFYRDRLFLASDDILVSSQLGNFDNFFLEDPSNITTKDPIDLAVSSNVYTPITYLQPFKDFLFLATSGDTQYELMGSENQISPLTAELAPTSFFPMTEDIEPLVMNNNLFFFSKQRLFIYFQSNATSTQQAFELYHRKELFKTLSLNTKFLLTYTL